MNSFFILALQWLCIPLLSPLCIGLTRSVKARLQNRKGASVIQPYKDIWKLFQKDEVISHDASWIFRFAPYIVFTTTLMVAAYIPLVTTALANSFTGDFLVVIYMLMLGTFFLALAGLDVGSPFGGFGSSREMMVAALTEGGLIVSLFVLAFLSHTTNLFAISERIDSLIISHPAPILFAFASFFICLLAETSRYPFDNPSTHLELTMIHEAMILEYSGKRLALMEWAAANKYLFFIVLGAQLFFPFGMAHTLNFGAIMFSLGFLIIKIFAFCVCIAVIESSIAKLRIFRLPDLLFTAFIISIVAIGLSL